MRNNLFANMENKFEFATEEEITETALSSLSELVGEISYMNDQTKFGIAVLGAKLGVSGDGMANEKEKRLVDEVFGRIWNGPMELIYEMVRTAPDDSDYDLIKKLTQLGNSVAIPFLHFILSFAYIDGVFEDDIAEKLDSLFGMNLMAAFIDSGLESVPSPRVKLSGLEAEIVEWFRTDDQLRPLADIQAHFPGRSKAEVKTALDSLCSKGLIYGGEHILNMYGLA